MLVPMPRSAARRSGSVEDPLAERHRLVPRPGGAPPGAGAEPALVIGQQVRDVGHDPARQRQNRDLADDVMVVLDGGGKARSVGHGGTPGKESICGRANPSCVVPPPDYPARSSTVTARRLLGMAH